MSDKSIAFKLKIIGSEETARTMKQLEDAIKKTNAELKQTAIGSKAYKELSASAGKLKADLDGLKKEQREVTKAFADTKDAEGSYNRLSKQLGQLRANFRALNAEQREGDFGQRLKAQIQQLDTQLKEIDTSIGNNQRNIGDYENAILRAFSRLGAGAGGLGKKLGGLAGATTGIANVGFALQGAFAIGQVALQAIGYINDFRKEIEETATIVAEFGEVSGTALESAASDTLALSKTFGVSTEEIAKAAQQLSFQLGTDFNTALAQVEQGLLNGQANAGDYLKNIAEFPSKFSAAGSASAEYSAQLQAQLEAEKALAGAQVELSKSIGGLTGGTTNLATKLKTGLITAVVGVISFLKPFADTARSVGAEIGKFFGNFTKGNSTFELFGKILNIALAPFKTLLNFTLLTVKGFGSLLGAVNNYIKESPALQAAFQAVGTAVGVVVDYIISLPDALNTALDSITAFSRDAASTLTSGLVDDSATAAASAAARNAGEVIAKSLVERYGEGLQQLPIQTQQAISQAGVAAAAAALSSGASIAQALQQGIAAADAAATSAGLRPVVNEVKKVEKRLTDEQKAAAKERAEELKKERKSLNEDLTQLEIDNAKVLLTLTNQLNNERAGLIQDSVEQARAVEIQRFKEQREAQEAEGAAFIQQQQEFEGRVKKLYGEGSTELKQFRQKAAVERQALEQTNLQILEAQEAQHQANLARIDKEASAERLQQTADFAAETLSLQQEANSLNAELQNIALQSRLDKAKKGSAEEKAILAEITAARRQQIADELELLDLRQAQTAENAQKGLATEANAFEKIAVERARLNDELSRLGAENAVDTLKTVQDTTAKVAEFLSKSIAAFSQLADAFTARRLEGIQREEEASNTALAALENRLENASGLEAQFVQQQIDRQILAADEIAKKRADVEAKAARRRKGVAIIESIINTAVEVTKVLANPFLAIAVGAFGALQTAAIAAQPLAKGGKVKGAYNNINGRISVTPNAPKSAAGDNTLIYAKTGEVVLNEQQQQRLGGAPTFRAIGVPGFATGGLIGTPPPQILPQTAAVSSQNLTAAIVAGIQAQTQTLSVELKTSDLDKETGTKNLVTNLTSF
jgi:hypothetical protein